nr:mucin-2-like [Lytechinus pictus]
MEDRRLLLVLIETFQKGALTMGSVNLFAAFAVMVFLVHNDQTVSATCSMDSDCLNGGTCDTMASTCMCTPDFTGTNCENENCDLLEIPFSNHTMNDTLEHAASIVVACDMGYSTGMGILTELMCDNGTLSAPPPVCYENCDIDAIPFSNLTMTDTLEHDASIVIACNIGYSTGTGILTELMCSHGTLSPSPPVCYENCDLLEIPFSNHTMNDTLEHDASIVVACDMGYSTGMGILTELMCDNGTLSAPPPVCYENCDIDGIPFSNQTINDTILEHDASIVVACDTGYSTGTDTLTTELMCDNGTLSASLPICYEKCDLEAVPNSNQTINVTVDHDATVIVECDSGYTSESGITTELTCDNGNFSPSPPTCSENCDLDAVPNSNQTTNVTVEHDATVVVACDSGYTSESDITTTELTCDNGNFSPSPPTCSATCTVDSDCLNGGTCNAMDSTCNCTSDFTGLNCETENCVLEAVPNTNQTTNVIVEHDATVTVACDSGYTSESGITTELTCDNGTFSSSPPTCSAEEQQNATATTMEEETTATTSDAVQQNTTTTDTVQQNTTSTTPMQENTTATSTPQDTASTTPMQENATPTSTPQNTTSTTPMQDNTTPTSTQQNTTSLTPMQDNTTPTSTPQNTTSTAPMQDNTTVTSTPQNTASTTPMQDNTAATSTPQNTTSTTPIQENTTATSTPQSTTDQQNTTTQNTTTTADTTTGSPTTDVSQETTSEGGTTSEAATTGDTVPETTSVMTTTTPAATTVTTTTTPATTTELSTTGTLVRNCHEGVAY